MAKDQVIERVLWNDRLCTVIGKQGRKYTLRDSFGYVHEAVPSSQVEQLHAEDDRSSFTLRQD
jgi:hypothetical protein